MDGKGPEAWYSPGKGNWNRGMEQTRDFWLCVSGILHLRLPGDRDGKVWRGQS